MKYRGGTRNGARANARNASHGAARRRHRRIATANARSLSLFFFSFFSLSRVSLKRARDDDQMARETAPGGAEETRALDDVELPGRRPTTHARVETAVTTSTSGKTTARESNRGAVRRYRDRQRERVRSLEGECALLREKNGRLEAELAHARWVLAEVRRHYALGDDDETMKGGSMSEAWRAPWTMSTIAHGSGCPLGETLTANGGPFQLRDGASKQRRKGRESGENDHDDGLSEFLSTFFVHDDGCPCPGHHSRG